MILASFLHNQTLIIVQAELQRNQEPITTNFSPDKNPAFYNYAHLHETSKKVGSRFLAKTWPEGSLILPKPFICESFSGMGF